MAHIAEREFELFVGIDWSGAKGRDSLGCLYLPPVREQCS